MPVVGITGLGLGCISLWYVKIGLSNDLVPAGNKQLPELILISVDLCRYMALLVPNELSKAHSDLFAW